MLERHEQGYWLYATAIHYVINDPAVADVWKNSSEKLDSAQSKVDQMRFLLM
jgi:uncharacterized protein YkwD